MTDRHALTGRKHTETWRNKRVGLANTHHARREAKEAVIEITAMMSQPTCVIPVCFCTGRYHDPASTGITQHPTGYEPRMLLVLLLVSCSVAAYYSIAVSSGGSRSYLWRKWWS